MHISDICFADDLMILASPTDRSIQVIKQIPQDFESFSGLQLNLIKCEVFFVGTTD